MGQVGCLLLTRNNKFWYSPCAQNWKVLPVLASQGVPSVPQPENGFLARNMNAGNQKSFPQRRVAEVRNPGTDGTAARKECIKPPARQPEQKDSRPLSDGVPGSGRALWVASGGCRGVQGFDRAPRVVARGSISANGACRRRVEGSGTGGWLTRSSSEKQVPDSSMRLRLWKGEI